MSAPGPKLSVVLVTPDSYETIRKTIGYLRRQTVCGELELVIVAPGKIGAEELPEFCRVQVVEIGAVTTVGRANVAGVRAATAPVVALAEDHAFPEPDWAAALIEAHCGPWAAVGPVVRNANPETAVSRADFWIGYGPWAEPQPAGPREFLPGHNSSYKRERLLAYGDRLEEMLEAETVLHWELRAQGHQLWLEPAARIAHVNFSRWRTWLGMQFHLGRVFAATRAQHWPLWKRIVFVCGSPLIPLVRLSRSCQRSPALVIGLTVDGLGQLAGYAAGAGDSAPKLAHYEFHREDQQR